MTINVVKQRVPTQELYDSLVLLAVNTLKYALKETNGARVQTTVSLSSL